MNKHKLWSRILCVVGLVATIVPVGLAYRALASYDSQSPEYPGVLVHTAFALSTIASGLVAFGAFLGENPYRRFVYFAFVLTLCGAIGLVLCDSFGFDAYASRYVEYAYLIGLIMSFLGALPVTIESFG
ncbi:MAG: hypothetical protein ACYDH4_08570 [Candidatus Cryosericum sp.]